MNDHDAQERLTRALHDHASDAPGGSPIGLEDVRRSARGIRRRRRVTTGLAAAAVLAVAVPVGLGATGGTRADRPVGPASNAPSGSPSPSGAPSTSPSSGPTLPRQEPFEVALTTHGVEAGPAPSITYLRARTLVTPEGEQQDLPADYDTVAAYRGGWLAVERREGRPYVVQLDATGSVVNAVPGGEQIVVSADGLEVAWVEGRTLFRDTTNGHSESPTAATLPWKHASPVGFAAPGTVVFGVEGAQRRFGITDFSAPPQMLTGLVGMRSVNEARGVLGVQTSYDLDNGRSCWAVRTDRGGGEEPESCDWTIEAFSPDGEHVAGYPSGTDGVGSAAVALLDARTLGVVARFDRPGKGAVFVNDVVWEDDSHVLAPLYEDGAWHLLRLGLDGSLETVDQTPGPPEECPFHFAARP